MKQGCCSRKRLLSSWFGYLFANLVEEKAKRLARFQLRRSLRLEYKRACQCAARLPARPPLEKCSCCVCCARKLDIECVASTHTDRRRGLTLLYPRLLAGTAYAAYLLPQTVLHVAKDFLPLISCISHLMSLHNMLNA